MSRGTSRRPIAPLPPATNTFITVSFPDGCPVDETPAPAVTPAAGRDHLAAERHRNSVAVARPLGEPGTVLDPAIESHYGIGDERSRLFPGGTPSLEFVRSMELLDRLLPAPPARLLDVGGGPGTYAAPLARRGYQVHVVDPVPLHVEQARQAAGADPVAGFTAALGDARELAEPERA